MPDTRVHPAVDDPAPHPAPPRLIWSGTGLCCEAQGDGVPCAGPGGECETCGRKLPDPPRAADE